MFIHLLAGSLTFLFLGQAFGIETTRLFLLIGAITGITPDILSYIFSWEVKFNKQAHRHRDNFSHSIFLPIFAMLLTSFFGLHIGIMIGAAMLTHPLLDLFGIGWGVKLFYPFSNKTYKLFYEGKILNIWNEKETNAIAEKFGDDHWIKNTYFKPSLNGAVEWFALIGFVVVIINA